MRYRPLGRTGLRVSLLSLGTGGPSQFGQTSGVGEVEAGRMLRRALELGVNFIDSSSQYGNSESLLGRILAGVPRDQYLIATKFPSAIDERVPSGEEVAASVEGSLMRLGVDEIDLLQFHGVIPELFDEVMETQLPTAIRLLEQGKCRFLGLSENYSRDHHHEVAGRGLDVEAIDAMMIAYSILSPSAEELVFDRCLERKVGVIDMVAVRRGLSRPEHLRRRIQDAVERGVVDAGSVDLSDPLGWLLEGHVTSLPSAGYKFAASHPAVATVLTGTANIRHLEDNAEAVNGPPLSPQAMGRIRRVFGGVRENLGD